MNWRNFIHKGLIPVNFRDTIKTVSPIKVILPMSSRIVHSFAPILLVGGADVPENVVLQAYAYANCVIGVDSGTQAILSAGLIPNHIMGDLDSVSDLPPGVPVHELADQNHTDLQKTLKTTDAPLYIGAGFLGGRLDHQLAAFSAIITDPRPIVLVDETQLVFHTPPRLYLDLPNELHGLLHVPHASRA